MTMRIRIENLDASRVMKVAEVTGDKHDTSKQSVALAEIPPGGGSDFWLHEHRWLVVEEKK